MAKTFYDCGMAMGSAFEVIKIYLDDWIDAIKNCGHYPKHWKALLFKS
jgi:hypothetical protein